MPSLPQAAADGVDTLLAAKGMDSVMQCVELDRWDAANWREGVILSQVQLRRVRGQGEICTQLFR